MLLKYVGAWALTASKEFNMLRIARLTLEGVGLLTIVATVVGIIAFFELATLLQYENKPEKADLIFPLAGDMQRVKKAAELYNSGFASKIFLSNEVGQPSLRLTPASYENRQSNLSTPQLNTLVAAGVPLDDVTTFGDNLASTAEEAEALRTFLGDRTATILLVTSPYEGLRAKLIFAQTLPNVRWLIVGSDSERFPERWWRDKAASQTAVAEVTKILYYLVGGVFRGPKASADIHLATH
jgi:uncharacterized SAM-binding protein YcdF (DUF218 family)